MTTFHGTYEQGLERLPPIAARARWLVLFLGSNIGNFDPPAARDMLRRIRASLVDGDALLLGTDLVKSPRALQLAYDDPLQVTAAFNRNLLRRINDELGGTFDLDSFAHRASGTRESRIEMHLVSTPAGRPSAWPPPISKSNSNRRSIWTESSYKYEPEEILAAGTAAGFGPREQWIDEDARFALTRFDRVK